MFIKPKGDWTRFKNDEERLEYAKKWDIVAAKAKTLKPLKYIGKEVDGSAICTLEGYVDKWTTVIDVGGELCCIFPSYLAEMQKNGFKKGTENEETPGKEREKQANV